MSAPPTAFPPRLTEVLEKIGDAQEHARFQAFFHEAAETMRILGELELAPYEADDFQAVGLELWEKLAPTVRDTLNHVNGFLEWVRDAFGVEIPEGITAEETLDFAFANYEGRAAAAVAAAQKNQGDRLREAVQVLQAICDGLGREVTLFGEGVRRPVLLTDRWQLLDHVAMFRGKFRHGVGAMVHYAASVFIDVKRSEVVPFYQKDVEDAAELRSALVDLRDSVRSNYTLMRNTADPAAISNHTQGIIEALETFRSSNAYKNLRAADKRSVVESRAAIASVVDAPAKLLVQSEALTRFLESMTVINRRETLITHDREAFARAKQKTAAVGIAINRGDTLAAAAALREALLCAQKTHGRDPALDLFVKNLSRMQLDSSSVEQLTASATSLNDHLERLL